MVIKSAIALAIVVGFTSGAWAATKEGGSIPTWDPDNCRSVYVGSDPRILINRPQMCYVEE